MILESGLVTVLRDADRYATLAINDFDGAFTDAVMPWLSNRFVWIPLYLLLFWFIWKKVGTRKAMVILLAVALCVLAIDQFANLIKHSVQRFRPCWDSYMTDNGLKILEKKGGKYGFFSAHAATTAGVAMAVLYFLRTLWSGGNGRYRILVALFAVWVLAISISRVYVGKHFLGDIIVGVIVGMIIARAISWLVGWIVTKYFPKFVG